MPTCPGCRAWRRGCCAVDSGAEHWPASRLAVLSIAHTAVSHAAGRLRYQPLAQDAGLDLTVIVPQRWYQFGRWLDADPAGESGIPVVPLPVRLPRAGRASWYLHTYPGLRRQVRDLQPDVIHLWEEPWSLVALQASILARRAGAALVLEVDQNIIKRLPPPFESIRRYVLARTRLVLSRSHDATAVIRAAGYTGPALPIGYGVDQSVFRPCGAEPAASPPFRLGYVGRLVEEKGLDDVLSALERLPAAMVGFTVMGEGPYERALRARVDAAGLGGRVTFQPWVAPEGVATFLQRQHAIILPTRTTPAVKEQFGRVIIEAQACGTPVIGSTSGAIPGVIGPGGWVVPERDPSALAALLAHLAVTPAEVADRGVAGQANIAARFTYAAVANVLRQGWRQAAMLHAEAAVTRQRRGTGRAIIAGGEHP